MNAAISISYPGDHRKGDGQILNGAEHAEMLYKIVCRYLDEFDDSPKDWPIFICATGFDGLTPYTRFTDPKERAFLWELWDMALVKFVTIPEVLGHLEGSTWSIRQGIEAAYENHDEYLVHTCEDVIPEKWQVADMVSQMHMDGLDYIGERWRETELSTQFFGCRVDWFYENFNGKGNGKLVEAYMADLLKDRKYALIPRLYFHSHTPSEFFKHLG